MILRSIYTYNERNGCRGVYNNQKNGNKKKAICSQKIRLFGSKLAAVPSKYKYIYIFYEIYRSSVNGYRFMVFEEKYNHIQWHMLPILLAKYGEPHKFDPILSQKFSLKAHDINHYSDRGEDGLFESGIRFSIHPSDLKILCCKVNLFFSDFSKFGVHLTTPG